MKQAMSVLIRNN